MEWQHGTKRLRLYCTIKHPRSSFAFDPPMVIQGAIHTETTAKERARNPSQRSELRPRPTRSPRRWEHLLLSLTIWVWYLESTWKEGKNWPPTFTYLRSKVFFSYQNSPSRSPQEANASTQASITELLAGIVSRVLTLS